MGPDPSEETTTAPDDAAERVRDVLERITAALGVEGEVRVEQGEDELAAVVDAADPGPLIGRRGQTIDAIQLLCYRIAMTVADGHRRVTVDAAGYRERRREIVCRQADRGVERALDTGNEIELEPMSATERKIVHDHLAERPGIETFSEGSEPERFVVVAPLVSD